MSIKIPLENLSEELQNSMGVELKIDINASTVKKSRHRKGPNPPEKYMYPYEIVECDGKDELFLPFSYGVSKGFSRPNRKCFPQTRTRFEKELRPEQKIVKKEAVRRLSKTGSVIVSAFPGFGKTATSLNIASNILKMKTLIVVNRIILLKQWAGAIEFFIPGARVQKLEAKTAKDEDADFYIINAINVPKRDRGSYADIGVLIVDELHQIMSEKLSTCMAMVCPRYLIGLSATPYRMDGMNILIDLFFGTYKIDRPLRRYHIVYKIQTKFVPTLEEGARGLNWGKVIESQCDNTERNEMIVRIVKMFPKRVFLIITKRVSQGRYLLKRLKEEGEDVTSLIGVEQEFEYSARILVGISQKTGTGFDHKRLNTLILATDVLNYFVQYLGRIFRTEDDGVNIPWVFDIVDDNSTLKSHARSRQKVFTECLGVVKNFSKEYPDFPVC